jgi:DNA-binding beta-propeller fold protein YncE
MNSARSSAIVASAALVVMSACAPRPLGVPRSSDFVVVSNSSGLAGFDLGGGRVAYQAPNAIGAPDWTTVYVARESQLEVVDGRTGTQLKSVPIPSGLQPITVSPDGSRVALAQPGVVARDTSRIVSVDPSGRTEPTVLDLQGNYEPDAFSSDNQRLFVLEYQPPTAPDRYRVRQLNLRSGEVSGVLSRYKQPVPEEVMRGTRHSHVLSPDRRTLYTLYTNQPDHLHSRDIARGVTQSSGDTYAFVHVLNLTEGWAYCLDLPEPFGMGPASAHALALSGDGHWLYIADRTSGAVAVADAEQLVIGGLAYVGGGRSDGSASATVAPDGRLLLSEAADVLILAPRTLNVLERIPLNVTPTGLGISRDGQRLFVGTTDRLLVMDLQTGAGLGDMWTAGLQRIEFVGGR